MNVPSMVDKMICVTECGRRCDPWYLWLRCRQERGDRSVLFR